MVHPFPSLSFLGTGTQKISVKVQIEKMKEVVDIKKKGKKEEKNRNSQAHSGGCSSEEKNRNSKLASESFKERSKEKF